MNKLLLIFMNVATNVLILPLQFFLNKVVYVYQLEKKLVNSNNGVADRESKCEKFQLFCRGSEN